MGSAGAAIPPPPNWPGIWAPGRDSGEDVSHCGRTYRTIKAFRTDILADLPPSDHHSSGAHQRCRSAAGSARRGTRDRRVDGLSSGVPLGADRLDRIDPFAGSAADTYEVSVPRAIALERPAAVAAEDRSGGVVLAYLSARRQGQAASNRQRYDHSRFPLFAQAPGIGSQRERIAAACCWLTCAERFSGLSRHDEPPLFVMVAISSPLDLPEPRPVPLG